MTKKQKAMLKLPSKIEKKYLIASATFLALAFALLSLSRTPSVPSEVVVTPSEVSTATPVFHHPLTGAALSVELSDLPHVYAVMIDNSSDAWPQSGIDQAFLVMEAPVEAGIPRLQAFFSADTEVEKIGPVRSARPYFVDWANALDALYVHVGGSDDALDLISSNGTFDLNEFWNGQFFWRAADRYAPHNTYTSTELLAEAVAARAERGKAPEVMYGTWLWDETVPAVDAPGESVSVLFSNSSTYTAHWSYDAATARYARKQGGWRTKTQDGNEIFADNVIVMVLDISVLDSVGRRKIRTTGEGKARVFKDGQTIEATWKSPSETVRTRFYDATGTEIALNPGTTWIEVTGSEENILLNE